MKSTAILDVMVKDHNHLVKYLKDVENNLTSDFQILLNLFNRFKWNLEKHFFVEERAIFTSYNPNNIENGYHYFSELSKKHTIILEKVESLGKSIQMGESLDFSELKTLLLKHQKYEEEKVYPVLDLEIDEGEKHLMIERINDVL